MSSIRTIGRQEKDELATALASCRSAFSIAFLFSLVINLLMLSSPIYMLQIYDRVLTTGSIETLLFLTLIVGSALLLMCGLDTLRGSMLVRTGCWLSERLAPVYLECGMRARLAGDPSGAQPLRDVTQIQNFIGAQALVAFFDTPWVPIFVAIIWVLHPVLGGVALVSAILLLILGYLNERATRGPSEEANKMQIGCLQQADVSIRNADIVTAMGMVPTVVERWRRANAPVNAALRSIGERSGTLISITKFTRHFVQIAILGVGAWLVTKSELTAGGMIAASILLARALAPLEMAIGAWRNFMSARLAYDRLKLHLQNYPPLAPRTKLLAPEGLLEVEHLTWGPPGAQPILRGVSFRVEPGEAVAIIGPSGAGKSTLCRFLVGLTQPGAGTVRLDGSELRHWDPFQLGRHVGFLPQDVELFPGTIRENIARMMQDEDDEAVLRAARLAHAHELIQRLPEGYDTLIGQGGVILSGGQRQRIGLARAVYGDPSLIVLDEPNANLDQSGEAALTAALRELKACGAALVIVGHRPSTLAEADKVLLMQRGTVALFGPRDEVLEKISAASAASAEREAVSVRTRRRRTPKAASAEAAP